MSTPTETNQEHASNPGKDIPLGSEVNFRSILTGTILTATLCLCNIYAGLKVGWGFNVAITAIIISYAFWEISQKAVGTRKWNILENNISGTMVASGAAVSSAGLVAPIPALSILTGQILPWHWLSLWVFSVCIVGISVAIVLRKQMLIEDKLPFPSGIAAGETLKEIYAEGTEALKKVKVLVATGIAAALLKIVQALKDIQIWGLPFGLSVPGGVKVGSTTVTTLSLKNVTFGLEPSLMLIGVGGLAGFRACWSLMLGSIVAWGIVAPRIIEAGWVDLGKANPEASWFGPVVKWLLWPGVAMMVSSSLTSFAFSWRSILATFTGGSSSAEAKTAEAITESANPRENDLIQPKVFALFLVVSLILSVVLQIHLFSIAAWAAVVGVVVSLLLAVVAGRVSGETNVTPVGAMGKVTQLFFGLIVPGNASANLMAANVTGGAASQCADLLHDLKAGHIVGASPRLLCYVQYLGALIGALFGSAAYLVLIPNPKTQLFTDEWPAPAVAAWLAVAEIFKKGFSAMPPGTLTALGIGAVLGILLAVFEKLAPPAWKAYIPSPSSLGLSFILPAYNAISMFIGGTIALVLDKYAKEWAEKYLTVSAAGVVAGESLVGVFIAVMKMASS